MNSYNFARSFLQWTSVGNNHSLRLQIDAACTLAGPKGTKEFFLTAMCTGETMYAEKDLIHLPANEFAVVFTPGEYMVFKFYADDSTNLHEIRRVGETFSTNDGRGALIKEMSVAMVKWPKVRQLTTYREAREAILGNAVLNARTEYLGDDGKTRVTLDYPVKICNVSHGKDLWQIDTPLLLPDFSAPAEPMLGMLRMGYTVWNSPTWAEVVIRHARTASAQRSHFSTSRRLTVANSLYACE